MNNTIGHHTHRAIDVIEVLLSLHLARPFAPLRFAFLQLMFRLWHSIFLHVAYRYRLSSGDFAGRSKEDLAVDKPECVRCAYPLSITMIGSIVSFSCAFCQGRYERSELQMTVSSAYIPCRRGRLRRHLRGAGAAAARLKRADLPTSSAGNFPRLVLLR